jgi:putative transposase
MPRIPKAKPADLPVIPAELLEQFGSGPMTAEAINAATLALKKALIERALQPINQKPNHFNDL